MERNVIISDIELPLAVHLCMVENANEKSVCLRMCENLSIKAISI